MYLDSNIMDLLIKMTIVLIGIISAGLIYKFLKTAVKWLIILLIAVLLIKVSGLDEFILGTSTLQEVFGK